MTKTIARPGIKLPPEIVDDLTRREFLVGAGLIALASACGSDGGGESGSSGQARTIEHELGTTDVPKNPRKVVAADPYVTLPTAMLLDVPVVGTGYIPAGEPFPPFLSDEETEGIEDIGWLELNLEKIASLEPDLIIGVDTFITEELNGELSRIAPTVATQFGSQGWKSDVRAAAEVFGKRDEADQRISGFEERIRGFQEAMGERLDGLKVSLVNIRETEDIRIYTDADYAGSILQEAGLERPEDQKASDPDETLIELSLELLPRIDADVIFYYVGSTGGDYEESQAELERIQENPLWQKLNAVQNDRAYRVDAAHWFGCSNIQAANLVLDDLEKHLLDGES